ncbi:MAG TPA: hypothetical protein VFA10_20565 [Ktedonobacteraceae bacterium]|nr:hypothetical protein [Ktedonobacteraceae bacterium]
MTLQFTCAQAVDDQADSVCVHTQAGAALTITVRYCSGYPAVSSSLQGTVSADASGNSTWTWTPETVCRGPAGAHVSATLSKHRASKSDTLTVQSLLTRNFASFPDRVPGGIAASGSDDIECKISPISDETAYHA